MNSTLLEFDRNSSNVDFHSTHIALADIKVALFIEFSVPTTNFLYAQIT